MAIDPAQYMDMPVVPPFDASAFQAPGAVFQPPATDLIPPELAIDPSLQLDLGDINTDIGNRYADLVRQLGYAGAGGQHVAGSIELGLQRDLADQARQRLAAIQGVTDEEQQRGTLWSGVRGLHQGMAESPILTRMAELQGTAASTLGDLYGQVTGLGNEYTNRIQRPLLDALNRRIAAINAAPADTTTDTSGGGVVTDPSQVSPDNPTLMTAAGPIVYATADTAASTPYYPAGTDIPALPGATGDVGGGAMRSAQPATALPPTNPQIGAPAATAQMQQAAQQQATHQVTVKQPSGQTITHKVIGSHPMVRPLVKQVAAQVALHHPPPRPVRPKLPSRTRLR